MVWGGIFGFCDLGVCCDLWQVVMGLCLISVHWFAYPLLQWGMDPILFLSINFNCLMLNMVSVLDQSSMYLVFFFFFYKIWF